MEAILHALGLCPDSLSHIDFMDLIACYYNEIQHIIQIIKMRLGS